MLFDKFMHSNLL